MAVAAPPWFLQQLFDNDGLLLAGGKLYSYIAYTTTPLATFTEATGTNANTNPIILDGSGRMDLWLYPDRAYTFVLTDENDDIVKTIDNVQLVEPLAAVPPTAVDLYFELLDQDPLEAGQQVGWADFARPVTFPADFEGSVFTVNPSFLPTSQMEWSIRKNASSPSDGTEVGTLTVETDGTYAYETAGNVSFEVAIGDTLSFYGPDPADDTAADFTWTVVGQVTGAAPGDYVTVAGLEAAVLAIMDTLIPPGSQMLWGSETVPSGWLECDGSELSRADYAKLFTKMGTRFGEGNGSTTFNIPDWRGIFPRGWDHGRGRDTDRAMDGAVQEDQLQGFVMEPLSGGDHFKVGVNSGGDDSHGDGSTVRRDETTGGPVNDGTNGDPRIGAETRPMNMATMIIVRTGL